MIKVPGTEAGLPAIEELTRRGVNVNVTLLFSIERYEQVIDAFLRGLSARAASRRAARCDRIGRIVLPLSDRHEGRRAAARRLAAARSRRDRQRAGRLPALPDQVRRPGMGAPRRRSAPDASGRCGPAPAPRTRPTPDVLYVSELIGPDVINTMPEQTLRAFADHGEVVRTLDADPEAAERTLAEARRPGSISTQSPRSSSARACSRSATPTTSCSTASRASSTTLAPAGGARGAWLRCRSRHRPTIQPLCVLIAGGGRGPRNAVGAACAGLRSPRHHDPHSRAQVHQRVDERRPTVQAPASPRPQAAGAAELGARWRGGAGPRRA